MNRCSLEAVPAEGSPWAASVARRTVRVQRARRRGMMQKTLDEVREGGWVGFPFSVIVLRWLLLLLHVDVRPCVHEDSGHSHISPQ